MDENFKQRLKKIKALVFDIDGVLTDGKITIHSNNIISRNLNTKDSYALRRATNAGLLVAIISFADDKHLKERFISMGVNEVYLESRNKEKHLQEFAAKYNLKEEEILFMGDDIPDLLAMRRSGIACCPYDAAHEIREMCVYVSPKKGGEGCVRDVVEQVLRINNKW